MVTYKCNDETICKYLKLLRSTWMHVPKFQHLLNCRQTFEKLVELSIYADPVGMRRVVVKQREKLVAAKEATVIVSVTRKTI